MDVAARVESPEAPHDQSAYDSESKPPLPQWTDGDAREDVRERGAEQLRDQVGLRLEGAGAQQLRHPKAVLWCLLGDIFHSHDLVQGRRPLQGHTRAVRVLAQVATRALEALADLPADRVAANLEQLPVARAVLNHGSPRKGLLEPLEGKAHNLEHPVEVAASHPVFALDALQYKLLQYRIRGFLQGLGVSRPIQGRQVSELVDEVVQGQAYLGEDRVHLVELHRLRPAHGALDPPQVAHDRLHCLALLPLLERGRRRLELPEGGPHALVQVVDRAGCRRCSARAAG
mmetsp:Transcript_86501/g.268789  ORF Transcript_86501/g.268789 Transcript_86501/m.268789 type:complete len:287 (+) Transcript_86501:601-1461(+)